MKKATIVDVEAVDRLAEIYQGRDSHKTIMEIAIKTGATIGERVKLPQIEAERTIIASRWVSGLKAVHITAEDWLILRHKINLVKAGRYEMTRAIVKAKETNPPRSRAKT